MNISTTGYSQPFGFNAYSRQALGRFPVSAGQMPGESQSIRPPDSTGKTVQKADAPSPQNSTSDKTSAQTGEHASLHETKRSGEPLTDSELRIVNQLKTVDAEVRRHEMAHIAAGGRYITSGANFSYKRGPDGVNYAVAGEVGIDTSPIPGDPEATMQKMRQIKASALAPANPSAQDLKVAAKATSLSTKAMSELMMLQVEERSGKAGTAKGDFKTVRDASNAYIRVNNLPESDLSTFQIAV